MSILSTDKKLISFGTDYSAGSGINIIDHTISIVPSAVGKVYSAGPNIGIYDVSGQPTISSKDWTQDIDQSSSGAVTESISYFNDWINGQYTEDISNVTNNLTALSGDLSSFYRKTETSSKEQINDALQYVSAHAVGDVEVNNYVHNNSATIDEVNSAYQSNSAKYLTDLNIPESATWNQASTTVQTNSAQWAEGGSVSSKHGTIIVDGSDVEATNKALEFTIDGFTSRFFEGASVDLHSPLTLTWVDFSEDTTFTSRVSYYGQNESGTFTYSSNTNVTGVVTIPRYQTSSVILQLPNATALQLTATDGPYSLTNTVVSAASSFHVSELAWKTDLPTYNYANHLRISAINGIALVGNEDYLLEQGFVQNLRSPKGTISLLNNNKIEGTNSAIKSDTFIEGFVSAYDTIYVYPGNSATLTWERYVPNTMLFVSGEGYWQECTLNYSADTGVTGVIRVPADGQVNVELPTDSKSIVIGEDDSDYRGYNFTVSAENYFEVGELAWASAIPTYESTDGGLVSAIGSSGLYSTSAGTANQTMNVLSNGNLESNIAYSANGHRMVLNPTRTPFGTTSGIFRYLTYATGACLALGSSGVATSEQYFGGYYKGNEWVISNAHQGWAMLAGFNRDNVYLSGVKTDGDDFNLCQCSVSGKNSEGSWKYGNEEDTLLRSLSSQIAYLSGVIAQYHP